MGLFRRQHPQPLCQVPATEKIYIFIRSSELSPTADLTWSLAVLQNDQAAQQPTPVRENSRRSRQKKQLFSLATRRDSAISMSTPSRPPLSRTNSTPKPALDEFTLLYGKLKKTHHTSTTSVAHHTAIMTSKSKSSSTLLQILMPELSTTAHPDQSLFHRIEEILHRVTATNTNSNYTIANSTWLKLCLIALQTEKILPSPSPAGGLNVETCMTFARNAFTGFEGECLREQSLKSASSGSFLDNAVAGITEHINLDARYTKTIDYAGHVRENERLRAMFGHDGVDDGRDDRDAKSTRSARGSVRKAYSRLGGITVSSGQETGQGGAGGGWWVTRPNDARSTISTAGRSRFEPGRKRDVYGGLM